jgi:hypothetical protein
MTSALSPISPLVSAPLHEDDTLMRIVLDRPEANLLAMAMMQPVVGAPVALERQHLDPILTSRDCNEGISEHLERRRPDWGDR